MERYGIGGSSPIRRVSARRKFISWRGVRNILLILFATGLVWCVFAYWNINRAATTDPMQDSDVGIVLGMSMWGDEASPGLKERLDYALDLYNEGLFKHFIVTGGLDKPDFKYTEAQGMRNYLVQKGVPESAISMENKATSTYENLLFSKEIMDREGWTTVILITHTYHGKRAQEIARELGLAQTQLGLTPSQVMSMAWHKSREVLAYTKWKGKQFSLQFD